jgi:transposase
MVTETLEPGASVSIVARRDDVNANQLFKWRREMMSEQLPAADESVAMLPVEIAQPVELEPERAGEPRSRLRGSGVIEITFAIGARVCLRGEVSPLRHRKPVYWQIRRSPNKHKSLFAHRNRPRRLAVLAVGKQWYLGCRRQQADPRRIGEAG